MRRLALLALLGLAVSAQADSPDYVRLRAQHKVVQASVPAALQGFVGTKVVELQGKVAGTCASDGATILLLQGASGTTQEIEAKAMPDWLADTTASVRLLVRCERKAQGGPLKATLLGAAPELDVLPSEEAYWRKLAEARANAARTVAARPAAARASRGSNAGSNLYGSIGGRSWSTPPPRGERWVLPADQVIQRYAAFIRGRNPRLNASQALRIAQAVVVFSQRYRIPDMRLVMAVLLVESGFNPNAVSRVGAVGLGQLMPGTARDLGVRNSYDSVDNLAGTIKLLGQHMRTYGANDVRGLSLALAAYNAGGGAVRRHGGIPPYRETQAYVRRVLAYYARLAGVRS